MTSQQNRPIRYAATDLAQKIAASQGSSAKTIQVQMIGNKEVSSLLGDLREARKPPATPTFRVK
jgi:hypothetical protein